MDYLRYERNLSERTIRGYSADLEAFERFYKGLDAELCWENLDEDVIRDWMMSMMERGNRSGSICCRLSSIRAFYRFLLKRGLVNYDPAHMIVAPKREKNLPVFVREEQMDNLLDGEYFPDTFSGVRDRLILMAFYSTGMRLSELTGLQLDDVDCKLCQVRVTGKRNKQRVIPFGQEMLSAIYKYLEVRRMLLERKDVNNKMFFLHEKDASGMAASKVRQIVQAYLGQVTTLKKKSPHVLRHSFATSMLNHRADLQSVKELLGHERLSTTEIYTHTTFEELKNMYNLAHPRAPKNEEVFMDIKIQAIHFEASEKLQDFIVKKTSKLGKFSDEIRKVEVSLKVVKPETAMNKETQIIVSLPGKELIAQETCDTFEEGVDKTLESLTRQLSKYKEKQKNR